MGATVTHLPSRVMYFQVSVVDQVLVFEPREPPARQTKALCKKYRHFCFSFLTKQTEEFCSKSFIFLIFMCRTESHTHL